MPSLETGVWVDLRCETFLSLGWVGPWQAGSLSGHVFREAFRSPAVDHGATRSSLPRAKEPYGWDFEVVRLLVLSLLRAGKIEATSKGQTIDAATSVEARDVFSNNNLFRQAAFRPKKGIEFEELAKASEAFRDTFGREIKELSTNAAVSDIRKEMALNEDAVAAALATLATRRLPGAALLESALGQMKAILRGSEGNTIATFNASHRTTKDAIQRSVELHQVLTEPCLHDLERAQRAQSNLWSFLSQESDISEALRARAASLQDLLMRETFFKELPSIEQHTKAIETEYARRFDEALEARVAAYTSAFETLTKMPGWAQLDVEQQRRLGEPFERGRRREAQAVPIPQLRADRDACDGRLRAAVAELRRIIDGERIATVNVAGYFAEGVETAEQLEDALDKLRKECARLISAGKKVILQ